MKTAISIPDEIFDAAEKLAKRMGLSRSELYARAVSHFIKNNRHERVSQTLDAVYADEPAKIDPFLAQLQWLTLPQDDWE